LFVFIFGYKYTIFLVNKWAFLSLFRVLISNIFVMQTGTNKSKIESMKIFRAVQTVLSKVCASGLCLLVVALFLANGPLNAQGWVKKIGGNGLDQAEDLLTTRDGGFVLLGFTQTIEGDRIFLTRTDIDGVELWSKTFGTANVHGYKMSQAADGSLLVVGDRKASVQSASNLYLLKVNQRGELLWEKDLTAEGNQTALDVIEVEDGGYLMVGFTDDTASGEDDILLTRLDDNGDITWTKTFGQANSDDRGKAVVEVADGFVLTGFTENPEGSDNDIITIKVDKQGELLWERTISGPEAEEAMSITATSDDGVAIAGFQGNSNDILITKYHINGDSLWTSLRDNIGLGDQASQIREMEDGSFLVTGFTEMSVFNIDAFVARVDAEGRYEWFSTLGPDATSDQAVSVEPTLDGGLVVAATTLPLATLIEDVLLFKTDINLNTLTNKIEGQILFDEDAVGCEITGNDPDFNHPRWIVVAEQGNTQFFGTTDENGRFDIDVSTGEYAITTKPTSSTWNLCTTEQLISFDKEHDTTETVIFSTTLAPDEIADLRIDISAPFVVEGNLVIYDVKVFNEGSEDATTRAEIQLDEELSYVGSKLAAPTDTDTTLLENKLDYPLGIIPRGGSKRFQILTQARPRGDDMRPAQAVMVTAKAEADNNVVITPSDPDLQVEINAGEGTATIRNIGASAILKPITSIVIQDDIAFLRNPLPDRGDNGLQPSEEEIIDLTAEGIDSIGSTLRVMATIEGEGLNNFGTQAVEPFGRDEANDYSTGFVTMFPEDDQQRNFEIDVLENIGPERDFELRGYPKGYGEDLLIAPNSELTYTIFFRNTGTDTINRVVVRDTLSDLLDLATVIPGASNLPYEFEVDDNGIVKFTFNLDEEDQLLPGSSTTIDTSSYGYVKFVVSQKPDLPAGSVIHNRAAVFFDYQAPEVTNEVTRIVGEFPDFIEFQPLTNVDEPYMEGVEINIYPNPFTNGTTFAIEGKVFGEVVLTIFDLDGKLVESRRHLGNKFMYYRNHQLPSGMYLYRLESEGQLINSGKLLVR
jgi:hypothetical protein